MGWFAKMCADMESVHGERGWKRRLAEMLGVSDSNVQNWIRVGDAPPIVKTAYEAMDELIDLRKELEARDRDDFLIERLENDLGYRVLDHDQSTGLFVERATTKNLSLSRAVVQIESGALQEKILGFINSVGVLIEDDPDAQLAADRLLNWNVPTRRERIATVGNEIGAPFNSAS